MFVMPSNNDPDDLFIPPVLNMDETFMDEEIDMNVTEVYTMEHIVAALRKIGAMAEQVVDEEEEEEDDDDVDIQGVLKNLTPLQTRAPRNGRGCVRW